jgi:hypothetical protein
VIDERRQGVQRNTTGVAPRGALLLLVLPPLLGSVGVTGGRTGMSRDGRRTCPRALWLRGLCACGVASVLRGIRWER